MQVNQPSQKQTKMTSLKNKAAFEKYHPCQQLGQTQSADYSPNPAPIPLVSSLQSSLSQLGNLQSHT